MTFRLLRGPASESTGRKLPIRASEGRAVTGIANADEVWTRIAITAPGDTGITGYTTELSDVPTVEVAAVHLHPNFQSLGFSLNAPLVQTGGPVDDVALVHLVAPLDVPPAHLNQTPLDATWIGVEARVVGYGVTQFEGAEAGVKRETRVPVLDVARTIRAFTPSSSPCSGDSGGPLYIEQDGQRVQIGISFFSDTGCGDAQYERVDAFLPWIVETMGPDSPQIATIVPPDPTPATAPSSLGGCDNGRVGMPSLLALVGRRSR